MAYLEIQTRDGTHRVELNRDRLSIGRLSYNDVVLPYPQISRQHAELRLISGRWWIADLQSTNGIQINSTRIQEHMLTHGDVLVLSPGITVRFIGDAPSQAAPAESPHPAADDWVARARERFSAHSDVAGETMEPTSRFAPYRGMPPADSGAGLPFSPPDDARPPASAPVDPTAHTRRDWESSGPPAPHASVPNWMRYDRANVPTYGPVPGRVPGSGIPTHGPPPGGPAPGHRQPGGESVAKLLHVCQTCGQLTAPDAIYCQNCQHPIAEPCVLCGVNLLPVQDHCPRCQTPNPYSVRRAHTRGAE